MHHGTTSERYSGRQHDSSKGCRVGNRERAWRSASRRSREVNSAMTWDRRGILVAAGGALCTLSRTARHALALRVPVQWAAVGERQARAGVEGAATYLAQR